MTLYCPGCGEPLYKVVKDSTGHNICPNPKCKIAIVGNGIWKNQREASHAL
jgi:uncharacterized Zn finger protein (UPF0148 family)